MHVDDSLLGWQSWSINLIAKWALQQEAHKLPDQNGLSNQLACSPPCDVAFICEIHTSASWPTSCRCFYHPSSFSPSILLLMPFHCSFHGVICLLVFSYVVSFISNIISTLCSKTMALQCLSETKNDEKRTLNPQYKHSLLAFSEPDLG